LRTTSANWATKKWQPTARTFSRGKPQLTLVWPRQITIEGAPANVTAIAESNAKAMSQSALPKLLIVG
jgi:hypothetical protein